MSRKSGNGSPDDCGTAYLVIVIDDADAEAVSLAWLMMTMPSCDHRICFLQFERHDPQANCSLGLHD
jgi:hypothetical protein